MRVLLAVPPGVEGGVAQPEVGGQVDDAPDAAAELGHHVLGRAVGQAEEHEVEAVAAVGVVLLERQVGVAGGQAGIEVGDTAAGLGVARGQAHVEVRVLGAEAEQLGPGEPRGADDADRCHRASIRTRA